VERSGRSDVAVRGLRGDITGDGVDLNQGSHKRLTTETITRIAGDADAAADSEDMMGSSSVATMAGPRIISASASAAKQTRDVTATTAQQCVVPTHHKNDRTTPEPRTSRM